MGASIWMRGGTIRKTQGKEVSLTVGWRSEAVDKLQHFFGPFPCEITSSELPRLEDFGKACEVYTFDDNNIWKKIAEAVEEYGCVTIGAEY